MGDPHRAVGLVHVLAARARGAVDVDAQVAFVDLHVDLLGFGQHRDGDGRGVDAALAFGRRHALHAVHAGFVFQPGEDVAAGDFGDAFLEAAKLGVAVFQDFEAPALQRRHIADTWRTVRRRTAPASSPPAAGRISRIADRVIGLVPRQQGEADLMLERGNALLQRRTVRLRPVPSSPDRRAAIRPRLGRARPARRSPIRATTGSMSASSLRGLT